MLKSRVISGLIMGLGAVGLTLWGPAWCLFVLVLVISLLGLMEFYSFLSSAKITTFRGLGMVGGALLLLGSWQSLTGGPFAFDEGVVFMVLTLAVFIRQFSQPDHSQTLQTLSGTLFGVLYVPFLLGYLLKLLLISPDGIGRILVLYLVVVVKCTDIGAYFIGCAIGRHKMAPRISPAKSWEGTLGGIATATLVSIVFFFAVGGDFGVLQLTFWDALALGLLLASTGVVGDLAESLLKRAAGVKDSSAMIKGMGGVLDVLDSVLFAAPVLYMYLTWLGKTGQIL